MMWNRVRMPAARLVVTCGISLAAWSAPSPTPAVAEERHLAIEANPAFVKSYFKGFVHSCTAAFHTDPDVAKMACACAAAIITDRFTIEELVAIKSGSMEDFDKVHSETSRLIGVCGEAAKAAASK